MDKNIYLVGFMGTGKTTVGKLLSQTLKRRFVEMDDMIEEREGVKIADIFSKKGESYFRKAEKNLLKEIAQQNNLIISCGGGIVIDEENIRIIKSTGIMICLEADAGTIYERIKQYSHRPLINVPSPQKEIEELIRKRTPFYRKAHFFIDTARFAPTEAVERIVDILNV